MRAIKPSATFKKLIECIKSLAYAFIVFLLLYIFLWPVSIDGVSMEPVVNHNDRVFISRALGFLSGYERGDIVLVKAYYNADRKYIIKRIAAVPGDELLIENGKTLVNGDPFAYHNEHFVEGNFSLVLPEGNYFLMGDNSAFSFDSRSFGPVSKKDIEGKVLFRFFGGSPRIR